MKAYYKLFASYLPSCFLNLVPSPNAAAYLTSPSLFFFFTSTFFSFFFPPFPLSWEGGRAGERGRNREVSEWQE